MRIENIRSEQDGRRARVAATVIWEDCDRPTTNIYFETDEPFAGDLTCDPHAFLLAAIMPAFCHGEQRILVDEHILPEMREGLLTAMGWIRHWWYELKDHKLPKIETKGDAYQPVRRNPERAGMFFSGGVDSLAGLRLNRLEFQLDHPWSVKDGLIVYGLETEEPEGFRHVLNSYSNLAEEAGITLIPVYTNVRYLDDDWMFWEKKCQDAIFASIAYAFSRRFNLVFLASTYDIPYIQPAGSHPLLDLAYSSSILQIRQDSLVMTRLEKVKLIAEWDAGLQHIRTCNISELYSSDMLNCGQCWKCVTTMLALIAVGALERTRAFPTKEVSKETLWSAIAIYKTTLCWWEELIEPLARRGRTELADIIEEKIHEYEKQQERRQLYLSLVPIIRRFDQKYLNANLRKYYKKVIGFRRNAAQKS